MSELFSLPQQIPLSTNGALLSGAKLTFYIAGTTTKQDSYTDAALTTPHTNPVIADGNGVFAPIYLDPSLDYKVDLQTSADVSLSGYPVDNVNLSKAAGAVDITDSDGNYAGTDLEAVLSEIADEAGLSAFTKVKTADTARNTTTTLADDPHLAGITLDANSYYEFELELHYTMNVGDFKFAFNIDNQDQSSRTQYDAYDDVPNEIHVTQPWSVSLNSAISITTLADNDDIRLHIKGVVLTHLTNPTSLAFEWAQNTSDANDTTLKQGSWMRFRKLS